MSSATNDARFEVAESAPIAPPATEVDGLVQAVAERARHAANSVLTTQHSGSAVSEIALGPRIANPESFRVADRRSLLRRATRRTLRFALVLFLGVAFTLA